MEDIITKIKEGIKLHFIETDKFKTNDVAIFLTTKLIRENVTKEALIPAVLRLGTNNIKTQRELNKRLEEMYGAHSNCGIEKRGDNHILKFYIETIDNDFTLEKENLLEQSINLILDIVLNPLTSNNAFNEQYVNGEKKNLQKIIEAKIDNKSNYAFVRCIEEMYKNRNYGLYEYGYVEDLTDINASNLYKYYKELLNKCKIDIFVSGRIRDKKEIIDIVKNNLEKAKLEDREPEFMHNSIENVDNVKEKNISESMNVTQGKLIIGMSIKEAEKENAPLNVYNAILGGGANSKLFQNVREKASLAYTAGSSYVKTKGNIFIRCGIEIPNYDKALKIIREQLQDIKDGKFSNEDISNAKELIIAGLNSIKDEQTSEISYLMSQEILSQKIDLEEYINQIRAVSKEDIIRVANKIEINTIYFLKN